MVFRMIKNIVSGRATLLQMDVVGGQRHCPSDLGFRVPWTLPIGVHGQISRQSESSGDDPHSQRASRGPAHHDRSDSTLARCRAR